MQEGIFEQSWGSRWRSVGAMATASVRADARRSIGSTVLDILVGVSAPITAVGIGMLVDAAASRRLHSLVAAVAVVVVSSSAILILGLIANRLRLRLEENVAHHVEVDMMRMVTGLPGVAHHENPAHLHRVDRLLEESWLVAMAVPALVLTISVLARLALTVALLGRIDRRMLLIPLGLVPSIWAGVAAERIRLNAIQKRAETGRLSDDIFQLVGKPETAGELRAFGIGENLIERHARAIGVITKDELDHRMRGGWRHALGWSVFVGIFTLGLVAVARRAAGGGVSAGQLITVVGLAALVIGQASSVSAQLNWVNWALTGVRHYVWLLDYDAAARRRDTAGIPAPDSLVDGIRFEDVSFSYPSTSGAVLDRLDLFLPAGSTVAIVGDNGAGKTTIVKLLLRLYEPTAGRITVDGVPLAQIDVVQWRTRATAALQDHTRPELLLGEAIGVGNLSDIDDRAAIGRAADRSTATAVIEDVPSGLEAQLGVEWPNGTELSGGQWQRVAVGRSAMRTSPVLLVLDEPTAALDPTAERALFELYVGASDPGRITRGAVSVVVSHRLSTVRMADLIVVLEEGRIVEKGSHEALLAQHGRYAALFELQAKAYR